MAARESFVVHDHPMLPVINPDDACAIADAWHSDPAIRETLTNLDLTHARNNASDAGAEALARVLKTDPPLRKLVLSYNRIATVGAVALADALAHSNTHLVELNLAKCHHVGPAGGRALGLMLQSNTSLTNLYISACYVGGQPPAEQHRRATSPTPEAINTWWCSCFNLSSTASEEHQPSDTAVRHITTDTTNHPTDDSGVIAIAEALRINTALVDLDMRVSDLRSGSRSNASFM
jgi:hypothetical protein